MRRLVGGLWLALVAVLTLLPRDPGTAEFGFACLPCGDEGAADGVLNLLLFLPLGFLAEATGRGWAGALGAGLAVSGLVELLQTGIPGRYPTLADLVFNGGGAAVGWLLARRLRAGRPQVWEGVSLAVGIMVLTAVLAAPAPPAGDLYGQHTPQLGEGPVYSGRLVEARIGDLLVGDGRLPRGEAARRALAARDPLEVRFEMGPPPDDWAPVFAVFSGDQEEAVFVAARDDDLEVRLRSRGGAAGFREPVLVRAGALAGRAGSDTVVVRVHAGSPGGWCLEVDDSTECGYGVGVLEGWRFLVGAGLSGGVPARAVSIVGLSAVIALVWAAGTALAFRLVGVAVIVGVAVLLPRLSVVAAASRVDLGLAVILGVWGGRSSFRSRWRKDLPIP